MSGPVPAGYAPAVVAGWTVTDAHGHVGARPAVAGVYGTGQTSVGFDDALLGRHVLFLGGIGTGKTVGMSALVDSLRNQMTADDVMVVFDTKGDYVERFFRPGDTTIWMDGASKRPGARVWNLFRELDDGPGLVDQVAEVADVLLDGVGESAGDNNRIWSNMARDLLAALIVAFARTGKDYSNVDIRQISDAMTVPTMRAILERHPDLRGTTQYIAKDESNTTLSVLIFLQQALRQVFAAGFKQKGDFSVRQFLRERGGKALFLEYDVASGTTLAPVFRTMLDLALKDALARDRATGRVFFVLDEFSLLPRLRHLDAGLNFGRSLGLRFVAGSQNVGQVHAAYGPGLADSVLSGFSSVFAFRLYDAASRDYVRSRYGANRTLVRYDASLKTRGVGEELIAGSVVEDWDLTGLAVGQCLVGLPDQPPARFTFRAP